MKHGTLFSIFRAANTTKEIGFLTCQATTDMDRKSRALLATALGELATQAGIADISFIP
jgi:hypothetical protein